MHFVSRLFLSIFCLWLTGCSVVPNELKTVESIMETHPDSALHILQHLSPDEYKSESNRALYGLLLFHALDKNDMKMQPDSLIDFSISYYLRQNDNLHLATCYFYKGHMFMHAQCYDKAKILYLKALDNLQNNKDYTLLGKIYADMGDICAIQLDYQKSLKKYKFSLGCFTRAGKTIDASYVLISIGRNYRFIKDYKSASIYYSRALSKTNDSICTGVGLQEIGINYYWDKQYDSARYYLRKSLGYPYRNTNYAIRCYYLADLNFNIAEYDSAYHYASVSIKHPTNFFAKRECYRILVNVEYLRKDIRQMGKYMTLYQSYSDSVRKVESQTKSNVLEALHNTSVETNQTKQQHIFLIWLAVFIIGASVLIYYLLHRRNKHEKQLSEVHIREQKLIIHKEVMLKHREALFQKIESIKGEQAMERIKASPFEKELMDKKLYNHLVHLDDPVFFFREMDTILNNLVSKLNARYPGITTKEMTWCCLHLLNVPGPDILVLLDYKAQSLIKLKQRLAQKINLANTSELNDFLDRILFEE